MTHILKNKKGVTLIELLAVVVILGIIAAIAVPTIGGLIARQEERAAEATYDAIIEAALLYADNEDVVFQLSDLDPDWIDLKLASNDFTFTADGTEEATDIYVRVVGTTVTFEDVAEDPQDLYINGNLVFES